MFTDTLLTILVIYSFAFFITGILMIILEPKGCLLYTSDAADE